ncbi:unnamed protein product [Calypogeia fissa]
MQYWCTSSSPTYAKFCSASSDITLWKDVTDEEMDETLWSNLPDALVDRIAASLPLPSLFRFRTVCKRFKHNLCQQSFRDNCEDVRKHAPHFLLVVQRAFGMAGLTYSLVFQKWYKMPFPVLDDSLSKFDIVASAGGLLCLKNKENSSLLVCNPITYSSRELPPLHSTRTDSVAGMAMDPNGKDYKIILWRDEHTGPVTKVYTSKTNQWALKRSVEISGDVLSDSGVVCADYFYILVIRESSLSVLAYKIEQDAWHELHAPMPSDILYGFLINHWGSLLMVGGIGKNFPTKGISVWKLDQARTSWIPILSMPTDLFDSLTENFQLYDAFNCAGQGDHICFIADRHTKALFYDFQRKAWQWSPHYTTGGSHHIVAIELSLNAIA